MGTNIELKQCSRCHSNILLEHFEQNRQGVLYKTCNNCRRFNKEYRRHNTDILREKDRERDKVRGAQKNEERKLKLECQCGASVSKGWKTSHDKTRKHLEWMSIQPHTQIN